MCIPSPLDLNLETVAITCGRSSVNPGDIRPHPVSLFVLKEFQPENCPGKLQPLVKGEGSLSRRMYRALFFQKGANAFPLIQFSAVQRLVLINFIWTGRQTRAALALFPRYLPRIPERTLDFPCFFPFFSTLIISRLLPGQRFYQ